MKRLITRLAVVAVLMLSFVALLAPATSVAADGYNEVVTCNIYDQYGGYVGTATTQEHRDGAVATGVWSTTNGAEGTLWAYHLPNGLFATVTQTSPLAGQGIITLSGPLGSLWYSMANGKRGAVLFSAFSPSTNVWEVHLRGPVPPIFLTS